jgi:hypothetical protein
MWFFFHWSRSSKTSDFFSPHGIKEARKIDTTVDIITDGPTPTLLDQLTEVRLMNKSPALEIQKSSVRGL